MKVHLIQYDEKHVYCQAKSWLMETTSDKTQVTCKVCKALSEVEEGKLYEIPFGGKYDASGEIRKNSGGPKRWKGEQGPISDEYKGLDFNLLYEDENGKVWSFYRMKQSRAFIREDGRQFSHSAIYNGYGFLGRKKD